MKLLILIWLFIGFFIAFSSTIQSKGKKIKPRSKDLILTVFLWPFYLVQVLFWTSTKTKEELDQIRRLLDENE